MYVIVNREVEKIYIGSTDNVRRRLFEHNSKRGNHFTAKVRGNWEVVYTEECENRPEAIKREKQLKSYQGRKFIKKLIHSPVVRQLADGFLSEKTGE